MRLDQPTTVPNALAASSSTRLVMPMRYMRRMWLGAWRMSIFAHSAGVAISSRICAESFSFDSASPWYWWR
ncbi:hypothetical protein D3C83_71040 [compost metagenome]